MLQVLVGADLDVDLRRFVLADLAVRCRHQQAATDDGLHQVAILQLLDCALGAEQLLTDTEHV
ncbi:hypothetical protein D3C81_2170710 [compost metagenome]